MTLRDCTLFVQVPRELISDDGQSSATMNGSAAVTDAAQSRQIRIVIADLDEKSEKNRGEYWKSLEDQLIQEGYYLGAGKVDNSAMDCDLSTVIWDTDGVRTNGVASIY